MFETDKEVLDWYEKQPRALSKEYVNSIKWNEIKNYEINPAFIPVLVYMRDIEYFTDMYYQELRRTPTGKDPIIRKFMDRWSIEELHHGNLLNRFLEEAGYPTLDETNTTCCYALQDKFWVSDPTGYRWEIYMLKADTEHESSIRPEQNACCA